MQKNYRGDARGEHAPTKSSKPQATFPPLETVTRPVLTTREYAYYTNIAEQTAWIYACKETGPIRPVKIGRRLGWPTAAVKRLCGVES